MKTIVYTLALALFVASLATPRFASAHASGPSANGTYRFVLQDGLAKSVEFSATSDERGATTGQMTFRDEAPVIEQDLDGTGERPADPPPTEFFMTASLDSLTIEHNRAVMGGTIRDSSNSAFIGRWVQLVVEDNGDNPERPDKVGWSFCQPEASGWTPVDAENPRDEGAWWHWWATDSERRDDTGVASTNVIPGTRVGCPAISLSAYDFTEVRSGEGQIQVLP